LSLIFNNQLKIFRQRSFATKIWIDSFWFAHSSCYSDATTNHARKYWGDQFAYIWAFWGMLTRDWKSIIIKKLIPVFMLS